MRSFLLAAFAAAVISLGFGANAAQAQVRIGGGITFGGNGVRLDFGPQYYAPGYGAYPPRYDPYGGYRPGYRPGYDPYGGYRPGYRPGYDPYGGYRGPYVPYRGPYVPYRNPHYRDPYRPYGR